MKTCPKCKIGKSRGEFCKDKLRKDNLYSWCKNCWNEYKRKYCKTKKSKIQRRKYQKEYITRNSEKVREYQREWNQRKQKEAKEIIEKYHQTEEYKEYRRKQIEERKEHYKKWARKYDKERRKNNPKLRVHNNISAVIYRVLKGNKGYRKWETLFDYTTNDLMTHLEAQFDENMFWHNYGSYWEIDHIMPVSSFNFNLPEDPEFKECWALSNLQPLERMANRRKSNKTVDNS